MLYIDRNRLERYQERDRRNKGQRKHSNQQGKKLRLTSTVVLKLKKKCVSLILLNFMCLLIRQEKFIKY